MSCIAVEKCSETYLCIICVSSVIVILVTLSLRCTSLYLAFFLFLFKPVEFL